MIDKHEQAIELIKIVRKFSKNKELLMHAKLELMKASILIHKNSRNKAHDVLRYIDRAKEGFKKFGTPSPTDGDDSLIQNKKVGHLEGLAESYFTEAQLYIRLYKNLLIHEAERQQLKN